MSGIAGILNLDGAPVQCEVLGSMNAALAHRGGDGGGQVIRGAIGFAAQLLGVHREAEVQPLLQASGVMVVWDGRLDNRGELLAQLDDDPEVSPAAPDSVYVRAAYEKYGEGFAERLNGDFALALGIRVRPVSCWCATRSASGRCITPGRRTALFSRPRSRPFSLTRKSTRGRTTAP